MSKAYHISVFHGKRTFVLLFCKVFVALFRRFMKTVNLIHVLISMFVRVHISVFVSSRRTVDHYTKFHEIPVNITCAAIN